MKKIIIAITLLCSIFIIQGCKEDMDLQPQDYFEGTQLEIAKTIYDGDERRLDKVLPTVSEDDLNRPAKAEITLLFWAINNAIYDNATPERLQIITDLIKAGADPLQPRPAGKSSPVEFVMKANKGVWIQAMLEAGLSPNARDKVNNQPIIFKSLQAPNTETLKTLIKYGADVNIKGRMNRTPLINSLYNSKIEHIEVLLDNGADPSMKDNFGDSFSSLISAEIEKGDKANTYIKELIKIKEKMDANH
ncbi:ankyrin repeat domain-containing protein [Serratia rhizosphaerae]|uniref:Ankyrin repeat domain-containing protein n=1 Tax=Serratia rhizosphaerae TaxID=2597702 RepID=A0ABX6GQL1_9GAMM|nr:ankyrin repeat domain-containing protein [Serratia rhizosphaerae]QHA88512.1 ankyrin repeat domain-containing protein [Serratia rhizosphaerae]